LKASKILGKLTHGFLDLFLRIKNLNSGTSWRLVLSSALKSTANSGHGFLAGFSCVGD
jgi:hypothetical protein